MIMNTYRSNAVLFGMPIVQLIYGDSQLGVMSMLIAVIVPLFNILSVIVLESFRGGKARLSRLVGRDCDQSADHRVSAGVTLLVFRGSSVEADRVGDR